MNWTKWSSIAEIVSSIAILATLIVLALELRGNSEEIRNTNTLARVATTQETANLYSTWRMQLASDITLGEVYVTGLNDYHGLSPMDQERFSMVIKSFLAITSATINAQNAALVGLDASPERTEGLIGDLNALVSNEGFIQWWSEGDRSGISGLMVPVIEDFILEISSERDTE